MKTNLSVIHALQLWKKRLFKRIHALCYVHLDLKVEALIFYHYWIGSRTKGRITKGRITKGRMTKGRMTKGRTIKR